MADSLQIAQNMIDAWLKLDWDTVTSLFTDQGSLVIVPARQTYTGAEAIRGHLDEVAGGIETLSFDIKTLEASGNTVVFERDDVFVYRTKEGPRESRVPCVGVMDMQDGRVESWREYFDGYTMLKAIKG